MVHHCKNKSKQRVNESAHTRTKEFSLTWISIYLFQLVPWHAQELFVACEADITTTRYLFSPPQDLDAVVHSNSRNVLLFVEARMICEHSYDYDCTTYFSYSVTTVFMKSSKSCHNNHSHWRGNPFELVSIRSLTAILRLASKWIIGSGHNIFQFESNQGCRYHVPNIHCVQACETKMSNVYEYMT